MLSFTDSEASSDESSKASPIAASNKGKATIAPGHVRCRRRPHKVAGGFMADTRRQPPTRACHNASPPEGSRQVRTHHSASLPRDSRRTPHPCLHVPRAGAHVDADSFTHMETSRRWHPHIHPRRLSCRPVPPTLVGLYFNCLAGDHITVVCRLPSRCLHCKSTGHRAQDCKRSRSPTCSSGRSRGTLRCQMLRHAQRRPPSPSITISGKSRSTGRDTFVPPVYCPHFSSPRRDPSPDEGQPPLQAL